MMRLILLGCVKTKGGVAAQARDLYQGQLWALRRRYAEATGLPWAILSAEYGVVLPGTVIEPYDTRIEDVRRYAEALRVWRGDVRIGMAALGCCVRGAAVEVHAGAEYRAEFAAAIDGWGVDIYAPLSGLQIGEQKRWYREWLRARGSGAQRSLFDADELRPQQCDSAREWLRGRLVAAATPEPQSASALVGAAIAAGLADSDETRTVAYNELGALARGGVLVRTPGMRFSLANRVVGGL